MSNVAGRDERARKTLYVTGFNPKYTTKRLLEELFTQGAPVVDISLFDTHAYVLFQHEESVPYCLALFNEIELHGEKLRLNPRIKSKDAFCYMNYLSSVRKTLMTEYMKLPQPQLPPKQMPKRSKTQKVRRDSIESRHKRMRKQPGRLKQMPQQAEQQNHQRSRRKLSKRSSRPRDKVRSRRR